MRGTGFLRVDTAFYALTFSGSGCQALPKEAVQPVSVFPPSTIVLPDLDLSGCDNSVNVALRYRTTTTTTQIPPRPILSILALVPTDFYAVPASPNQALRVTVQGLQGAPLRVH